MNADRRENPSVDVLRAAIRESIGPRSLRTVAEDVGISHTGLRGFLRGSNPHRHTRIKLENWLLRARTAALRERGEAYAAAPGRDSYRLAEAIVRALAAEAEPGAAGRAARELAESLRRIYSEAGKPAPAWLSEPES